VFSVSFHFSKQKTSEVHWLHVCASLKQPPQIHRQMAKQKASNPQSDDLQQKERDSHRLYPVEKP
jgi:hypothetical protein